MKNNSVATAPAMKRSELLKAAPLALLIAVAGCGGSHSSLPPASAIALVKPGCAGLSYVPPGIVRCERLVGYTPRPVPGHPGLMMTKDGSFFVPPDARPLSSCGWSGNVPPPCDNSGASRRVYSGPNLTAGYGYVGPLPREPGMVQNYKKDTGCLYVEGWPNSNRGNNAEIGIFYEAVSKDYAAYYSIPGFGDQPTGTKFPIGSTVQIVLGSSTDCGDGVQPPCLAVVIAGLGSDVEWVHWFHEAGWTLQCCVFARMTTIAQPTPPPPNDFSDGSEFRTLPWTNGHLFDCPDGSGSCSWHNWGAGQTGPGGFQCYPNNTSGIIVTGRNGEVGETDTIDLNGERGNPCSN